MTWRLMWRREGIFTVENGVFRAESRFHTSTYPYTHLPSEFGRNWLRSPFHPCFNTGQSGLHSCPLSLHAMDQPQSPSQEPHSYWLTLSLNERTRLAQASEVQTQTHEAASRRTNRGGEDKRRSGGMSSTTGFSIEPLRRNFIHRDDRL